MGKYSTKAQSKQAAGVPKFLTDRPPVMASNKYGKGGKKVNMNTQWKKKNSPEQPATEL